VKSDDENNGRKKAAEKKLQGNGGIDAFPIARQARNNKPLISSSFFLFFLSLGPLPAGDGAQGAWALLKGKAN